MLNKYEVLQEKISNQPALGQQRLKNMLQFLREGHVGKADLEKILTYEYKGKSEEQTELYNILVGLVIDLYIKENSQEVFLKLYNELQGEKAEEQLKEVEKEKPKEKTSEIFIPQNTDRTPKAVSPRKKIPLVSQKKKEVAEQPQQTEQQPIVSVEPTLPKEEPKEVEEIPELVEEEQIESIKPTPYVAPTVETILEEIETEVDEEEEIETEEVEVANDEEDDFDEEEELEERKKSGVFKYLAIGIPTVLIIGSLAFWQVTTNNKNTSRTEQQVAKILEEAPKESKKGAGLSSSEYDDNIKTLTQGIDSIKQNDKTGLSGYLVVDDKKYIIQKYDQASGSLTVFDADGEKIVFDEDWVQKLIDRSKEGKTKLPDSSANGDKISVESKESESSTDTEGSN
jgi:tryptophan-rich antigen (Pv-fam-a)